MTASFHPGALGVLLAQFAVGCSGEGSANQSNIVTWSHFHYPTAQPASANQSNTVTPSLPHPHPRQAPPNRPFTHTQHAQVGRFGTGTVYPAGGPARRNARKA